MRNKFGYIWSTDGTIAVVDLDDLLPDARGHVKRKGALLFTSIEELQDFQDNILPVVMPRRSRNARNAA